MEIEKKGDPLNQMAIIVDLIERLNLSPVSSTVIFEMPSEEYEKIFKYLKTKVTGTFLKKPGDTFTIEIGEVTIVFNRNSDETTQSS